MDREDSLWVGSDGGGLNRVKSQVFGIVDFSEGSVQSVTKCPDGGMWIAYNGNRIDYWKAASAAVYSSSDDFRRSGNRRALCSSTKPEAFGPASRLGGTAHRRARRVPFPQMNQRPWIIEIKRPLHTRADLKSQISKCPRSSG
jgi:hypothetical protein